MKFLLPHRYKKIGAVIAPLGFALWLSMQSGLITKLLLYIFGEPKANGTASPYHITNVPVAVISFFSFLGGIYLVAFSREKLEDEMIQRTRLDSFQFAALVQIIFAIAGFLFILLVKDPPGDGGLMLFFIVMIFLFWLSFLGRFNYILHIRLRQ